MTCDELREDYELYALGVAEDPERSEIRVHLMRGCETCTSGVRRARGTVSLLATTAPSSEPPARLRKRVLAAAGVEEKRGSRNWQWLWAAATAAAVLTAVYFNLESRKTYQQAQQMGKSLSRSQANVRELAQQNGRLYEALSLLNEPGTKQVTFGTGAPQPPRGQVYLNPSRGVLLIASNLPPAPSGKTYEMWVIPKGGKPVPAGLFQSDANNLAFNLLAGPVDVAATAAIAVTLESAGGAPQPTSTPLIVAAVAGS